MNLSDHFTLDEFTQSQSAARLGIDNTPPPNIVNQLLITARGLERVRALLGKPISVSSGYRSAKLNKAIGGAPLSQHISGEAVDFISPGFGSPLEVCKAILKSDITFDQMIYEGAWVHISFVNSAPRHQVLTAKFFKNGVSYSNGLNA